jgi:hypothetical protein
MEFKQDTHEYLHNGDKYISVTELLKKYNLSVNYNDVPPDVLAKAATRGKATHSSLEAYIKGDRSELNITPTVDLLHNYINTRGIDLTTAKSEEIVFDTTYKIAGTVDFQYFDGENIIADFKTTSTLHLDVVAWQLSIYNYIISKGDIMSYYFNKLKVFHFTGTKLYVKDVYLVEYDTVKALLETNLNNEPEFNYVKPNKVIVDSDSQLLKQILNELQSHKDIVNRLEEELDNVLNRVKENMVRTNDYTYHDDEVMIQYNHPMTRVSLDQTKVKEYLVSQNQDINNFSKTTTTKDSVKAVLLKK